MPLREIQNLCHFGFGNLVAEDPDHSQPLLVNRQHDLERLRVIQLEETFKHMHDKLHRRIVVIQKQHLVHGWLLRARARFDNDTGITVIVARFLCH